jgi:hypothetical protein
MKTLQRKSSKLKLGRETVHALDVVMGGTIIVARTVNCPTDSCRVRCTAVPTTAG